MDQSKCICQHRLKEETNKSECCVSMLRTNLDYIATSLKKKKSVQFKVGLYTFELDMSSSYEIVAVILELTFPFFRDNPNR